MAEDKDKEDKDLFICPQEIVVGYSKAPEQPQSSARPRSLGPLLYMSFSRYDEHGARTSNDMHWSSPHYALRHGRRHNYVLYWVFLLSIQLFGLCIYICVIHVSEHGSDRDGGTPAP